jgi:hypothetical protein
MKKFLTVLDFGEGKVYKYVFDDSIVGPVFREDMKDFLGDVQHEDIQDFLANCGHSIGNIEWMITEASSEDKVYVDAGTCSEELLRCIESE